MSQIVSRIHDDVEYIFDDMLLEEEDEMTESDIHHIEIFGKPYSIAMGKLKKEDDNLGYFVCYLLYGKKVIRKLGIYEIEDATNIMASLNHRVFDFEKEQLILFDEYYEDTEKLQPYMYKKEDTVPNKTVILLKGIDAEFEEDVQQQKMLLKQLQARVEKNKPEKTPRVLDKYDRYISFLYSLANEKADKENIKKNLRISFKKSKEDGKTTFIPNENFLHENLMKSDVALDVYNLIMFEFMANIKIIIIENEDFDFHFLKHKENANYEKMNKLDIYNSFDPKDVMFIHKTTNEDEETHLNMLQYNDKLFISFDDLANDKILKLIEEKLNENLQEVEHPTRFAYLKSAAAKIQDNKEEPEKPEEGSEEEDEEPEKPEEEPEEEPEEPEEDYEEEPEEPQSPQEETKGRESGDDIPTNKKITLNTTPLPKLK